MEFRSISREIIIEKNIFLWWKNVLLGKHTGIEMLSVTKKMQEENKQRILKGDSTNIPGDIWGIKKLTNMVTLPNSKTDATTNIWHLFPLTFPKRTGDGQPLLGNGEINLQKDSKTIL